MNICEYLLRRSRGEHSSMFTETEANNCFSKIFSGGNQELQNNRLKHKNRDVIFRVHAHIQLSFHKHQL